MPLGAKCSAVSRSHRIEREPQPIEGVVVVLANLSVVMALTYRLIIIFDGSWRKAEK